MQSTIINDRVIPYIRTNWFKLLMVSLILFVFISKDFSFSINFNSPDPVEEEMAPPKEGAHQKKSGKKPPQMTVKQDLAQTQAPAKTKFDMLELPSISIKGGEPMVNEKVEFFAIDGMTVNAYITRFGKVAVNESKKFGVPASIILGNALLHSSAGTRNMAIAGNNHFALPCTTNWRGESGTYDDACYRHYENAWTSFRDHSLYLTTGSTTHLVKLGPVDYKAWASAMEKVSVFEMDQLETRLIAIIEQYELHKLDQR